MLLRHNNDWLVLTWTNAAPRVSPTHRWQPGVDISPRTDAEDSTTCSSPSESCSSFWTPPAFSSVCPFIEHEWLLFLFQNAQKRKALSLPGETFFFLCEVILKTSSLWINAFCMWGLQVSGTRKMEKKNKINNKIKSHPACFPPTHFFSFTQNLYF